MPVRVKLKLFGQLRTLVDAPKQELELPPAATVIDLFQALSERYGSRFQQRTMEMRHNRPALQRHVLVFVNDQKVEGEAQSTLPLGVDGGETEVEVYVMLPFTGGRD